MSYFGTDGIRGKFGVLPITPEFALKLGFAAGKVLKRHSKKSKPLVVLGKDTRLSGYILESALQAGLNAAGVYVHLLGPLPTPAIAHLTRALHASLGIVISASHNPYFDLRFEIRDSRFKTQRISNSNFKFQMNLKLIF
jgi:phosphoglucosamine mutase